MLSVLRELVGMITAIRRVLKAPGWRIVVGMTIGATVVVTILVVHALEYRGFFADDGFISLRYAKRLIHGQGLTWSGGERVEGYTNFLWILLVAAGGWVTRVELVYVARVLGIASASVALLAILISRFPRRIGQAIPNLAVAATVALYGPFATWAIGGLEQPLLAALVAWALVFSFRIVESERAQWLEMMPASASFALAALVRPDAILFAGSAMIGLVLARGLRVRAFLDGVRLLVLPLMTLTIHVIFRKLYYGDWVPNTFRAKVVLSWDRVHQGWIYVSSNPTPGLVLMAPLMLTLVAALCDSRRRRRVILISVPLVVWIAYVTVIGGDIMPRHRHLVPAAVLLGILNVEGFAFLAKHGRFRCWLANVLALACITGIVWSQVNDPSRARVLAERWEWRGRPVGIFLRRCFADKFPLLAVDAAGATPYYAEIDVLDMLGLNDRYLASHPPADFGKGWIGHELGDGSYVLRRKPDFVMFARPPGARVAMWRGGHELQKNHDFKRLYKLISFDTGGKEPQRALIWVRFDEGRIGIQRAKDQIDVPGYLLATDSGPIARLDKQGRLGTQLEGVDVGRLPAIAIPVGLWRVRVDAEGDVTLRVSLPGSVAGTIGASAMMLDVSNVPPERSQQVSIEVRLLHAGSAHIRSITLERIPGRVQ